MIADTKQAVFRTDDGVCVSSTRQKENTTLWGRPHCRSTLPLPWCRISGRCSALRTWAKKNGKPFFNGPDVPPRRRICGCWSGHSRQGSMRPSMTEHFPDVCGPGRGFPLPGFSMPASCDMPVKRPFQNARGGSCDISRHICPSEPEIGHGITVANILHDLPQGFAVIRVFPFFHPAPQQVAQNAAKVFMPRVRNETAGIR